MNRSGRTETMPKIVIIQPLPSEGYKIFDNHPDIDWEVVEDVSPGSLATRIADADGLTVRVAPLPAEVLESAAELKVISRHGVGYDNIPVDYCTKRGIPVAITAGANSVSVAEHAMFLMLAAARNAIFMDQAVRDNRFSARSELTGIELCGRTLLIVGFGRIGRQLASRAMAFGMEVLVFDPYFQETTPDNILVVGCLEDGLSKADFVSLHIPLTSETQNLIGSAELDMLPEKAVVVNASRGGIIDEDALLENIRSGRLHGAGLDTFAAEPPPAGSPLFDEPRIVLSPHSAALTEESLKAMGSLSVQNAIDGIKGRLRPEMVVNPSVLG